MPKWYREQTLSTQLVPVALFGFAYAIGVIWYGLKGFHLGFLLCFPQVDGTCAAKGQAFLVSGKGMLWLLLLAVESAVWFVVIAAYVTPEADTEHKSGLDWWVRWVARVVVYALIVGVFILPMLYTALSPSGTISDLSPLIWHGEKMLVWMAAPAVAAVVCVIARLRDVEAAAKEKIEEAGTPTNPISKRVKTYLDYQDRLRFALGVLGLMLSLNVLTTGALRNALQDPDGKGPFGVEMVLAFGGAYTFLVIAFYAPIYMALSNAGHKLVDDAAKATATTPPAATTTAQMYAHLQEREKWDKVLGLERDWLKSLQAGLVLLSPFFAALVSLLLPSGR
jgi:hypothetical protein